VARLTAMSRAALIVVRAGGAIRDAGRARARAASVEAAILVRATGIIRCGRACRIHPAARRGTLLPMGADEAGAAAVTSTPAKAPKPQRRTAAAPATVVADLTLLAAAAWLAVGRRATPTYCHRGRRALLIRAAATAHRACIRRLTARPASRVAGRAANTPVGIGALVEPRIADALIGRRIGPRTRRERAIDRAPEGQ
jgi:hypothetical protein